MRSVLFWITSGLLVLGALSATVALVTVRWLYPTSAASVPPPEEAVTSPPAAVQPLAKAPAAPTSAESGALEFIRRAAAGDVKGAKALASGLPESLYGQIAQLGPVTQRAAALPGAEGAPASVLVWSTYRREGNTARGAYQVTLQGGKVTGVSGPYAPDGGYQSLPWTPTDEKGRRIDLKKSLGRGLVLFAPRAPEAELVPTLSRLQPEFARQGVDLVLVVDMGGPDLSAYARSNGYSGPIWRIKGHIDELPLVTKGRLLGAIGLMIDRSGTIVASLTALDPARYGLDGRPIEAIAPAVFRAYGLTQ